REPPRCRAPGSGPRETRRPPRPRGTTEGGAARCRETPSSSRYSSERGRTAPRAGRPGRPARRRGAPEGEPRCRPSVVPPAQKQAEREAERERERLIGVVTHVVLDALLDVLPVRVGDLVLQSAGARLHVLGNLAHALTQAARPLAHRLAGCVDLLFDGFCG